MNHLDPRKVAALPQFPTPPARPVEPPEPTSVHVTEDMTPGEVQAGKAAKQHDPWDLEDDAEDSYDPGKFYVKTVLSKRQGGSPRNVQVPLDPQLHMIVSAIVQQRVVPAYNTVQDLIRDAVFHRVHQLTHGEEGVPVYIEDPQVVKLAEQARAAARQEMMGLVVKQELETVQRLHDLFDDLSLAGNRDGMRALANEITDAITDVKGANSKDRLRGLAADVQLRLAQMDRGNV